MYVSGDTNTANIVINHTGQYPNSFSLAGINISISADELQELNKLIIYPTATTNSITIETGNRYKTIDYRIYNLTGQLVSEASNKSNQSTTVEVSHHAPGNYFIQVGNAKDYMMYKFCKD